MGSVSVPSTNKKATLQVLATRRINFPEGGSSTTCNFSYVKGYNNALCYLSSVSYITRTEQGSSFNHSISLSYNQNNGIATLHDNSYGVGGQSYTLVLVGIK